MRLLRPLGFLGAIAFTASAFTPLPNWLNQRLAGAARLEPADAIVVLGRGGADSDGVLTNRSLRRILHAIDLYQRSLAPLLVVSSTIEETRARVVLAQAFGVPAAAILTAAPAPTTRVEAEQLRSLLIPRGYRRILLVVDPVDMPRARAVMERAGFTVLPAPTLASGPSQPEARLALLRDIVIEVVGWAYYCVTGAV